MTTDADYERRCLYCRLPVATKRSGAVVVGAGWMHDVCLQYAAAVARGEVVPKNEVSS